MKSLMVILMVECVCGAREDEFLDWDNLTEELQTAFSYNGNVCISMGRRIRQSWRLARNELCNADYALGTKDAEYFFYREQEHRDRIYEQLEEWMHAETVSTFRGIRAVEKYSTALEYKKEEYYCRNDNPIDFKFYCSRALHNRRLKKEGWLVDEEVIPRCEFRRVFLLRFGYRTERMVLKCSYKKQKEGQPVQRITAFISAVEGPPPHRLILYMFKAKNLSDPFTSSKRTSEEDTRARREIAALRARLSRSGRFREELGLFPLTVLTLLINKRHEVPH